jgi:hypothetical protein
VIHDLDGLLMLLVRYVQEPKEKEEHDTKRGEGDA